MQNFGEQLTAARKAKGMTQEALAQAAAVTRQTISSWERGRTLPDVDSVRRLSSILGVEFMQLDEGQNAVPAVEAMPEVAGETAPAAAGKRQLPPTATTKTIPIASIATGCLAIIAKPAA